MPNEDRYESIRRSVDPSLSLVAGSTEDRLSGLDPLLAEAKGRTVLDIACHIGTVAEAFAASGATRIDGVDFYRPGLKQARQKLRGQRQAEARFRPCDLTHGAAALREALPGMPEAYDIVLYLGIQHHLTRQMDESALHALLDFLIAHGRLFFAVRTPEKYMAPVACALTSRGWTQWYEDAGNVGVLRVYRR